MSKMGVACAGRWRGPFRSMWTQTPEKKFSQNSPFFFGRLPRVLPARENRISTQGAVRKWLRKIICPYGAFLVCGALASLPLCRSCVAAAVPLSPRCCRTAPAWLLLHVALSHRPCCGTLDRTAAAVALSHITAACCAALAWLLHAVHGALASLLPCLSRLAAAAAFSP